MTLGNIWNNIFLQSRLLSQYAPPTFQLFMDILLISLIIITTPVNIIIVYSAEGLPMLISSAVLFLLYELNGEIDNLTQMHACMDDETMKIHLQNVLSKYRLLKPLMEKTNKTLSVMFLFSIGFYIPFFAFQTSIVFTNAEEQFGTILFHTLRQYSSLVIFMGLPSEIHRQVLCKICESYLKM